MSRPYAVRGIRFEVEIEQVRRYLQVMLADGGNDKFTFFAGKVTQLEQSYHLTD